MKLIPVYARREITTDRATQDLYRTPGRPVASRLCDVQIYRDPDARQPFARFPWYSSNCPTRRHRYVTLNCYRWQLVWL
jgi:hypothetical protein